MDGERRAKAFTTEITKDTEGYILFIGLSLCTRVSEANGW